jgi:predicted phage-related endonuclease
MAGKLTSDKVMSASRLPGLMGYSKYSSPNDELQYSINAIDGKERPDIGNEHMAWGNTLEPVVLTEACKRLGIKGDFEITVPFTHPTLPLQCSLDGIGFGQGQTIKHDPKAGIYVVGMDEIVLVGEGVLEAKTTKVSPEDTPHLARGPIQLQGQMMITDKKWGAVCVFYQGAELRIFLFAPHQQTADAIAKAVVEFDKKVQAYQDIGAIDWYPPDSSKDLNRMHPVATDEQIDMPLEIAGHAAIIVDSKNKIKMLEEDIDEAEQKIKSAMGVATKAIGCGFSVSWPMRSYKAQPAKVIAAKDAYTIRQSSLTIKETDV